MKTYQSIYKLFAILGTTLFLTDSAIALAASEENSVAPQTNISTYSKQNLIKTAADLVKNGQMKEAYTLLTPYHADLAGDPDFDYLLGIAALDSGKINEAIFALERVLAVKPNHLQARAEIARAYLEAGETSASKREFEAVQKQNPPSEVSATIQKYLDVIETTSIGQKSLLRGYVEITLGKDSNVNTATSNKQIAIPLFGDAVLSLSAAGIARSNAFGSIATGFNMRHELATDWSFVGAANINKRNNATELAFNSANADINVGINLGKGNNNYLTLLQFQSLVLDNVSYRDALGLTAQWQRILNSGSQLSSYLQYSSLSYPDQTYRDANRYVLGGAYATSLGMESNTVVYAGIYAGSERPRQSDLASLGNTFYGGRLGGEMKLNSKFTFLASASMELRMYGGTDSLFLVTRRDTQSDLKVGINYLPTKEWTISPSVAYTSNNANIIINKYERTLYSVSARRDFN